MCSEKSRDTQKAGAQPSGGQQPGDHPGGSSFELMLKGGVGLSSAGMEAVEGTGVPLQGRGQHEQMRETEGHQ